MCCQSLRNRFGPPFLKPAGEQLLGMRHRIMKRVSGWLYKVSSGWVALVGLVIFLLFTGLVLPAQAAGADTFSEEAPSPDMSFYYSSQQLYEMAEAYGEDGRVAYIRARFSFDLIWPIVYTFFLTTAISWVFSHSFPIESRWRWANLMPILGMIFDYLENISTSLVMWRYPFPVPVIAWFASVFTPVKWFFVIGSFMLLLIGVVLLIWKIAFKRRLK